MKKVFRQKKWKHESTQELVHECSQFLYLSYPHAGNNPNVHQQVNGSTVVRYSHHTPLPIREITWMDLKIIMQSESNKTKSNIYYMIHLYKIIENSIKSAQTESRSEAARGWGQGKRRGAWRSFCGWWLCPCGYGSGFMGVEKYQNLSNCTLYMPLLHDNYISIKLFRNW